MGAKTGIEWCDSTWNPVRGCSRVSEGCRNCYAERVAARFSGPGQPYEGLADPARSGSKWTGKVKLIESALDLPLRWRKPRRIFVNSMSDLFHEALPDEAVDKVFAVMALCPQHTFQVLTKRPERMRDYVSAIVETFHASADSMEERFAKIWAEIDPCGQMEFEKIDWPLPNGWLGVSVENQETADERIPLLLDTPAAVRFVSCEPLLGPVDLRAVSTAGVGAAAGNKLSDCLHWVIAGSESGPGARACELEWIRGLKNQCVGAGLAFFYKQAAINGRKLPTPELDGRKWTEFPR